MTKGGRIMVSNLTRTILLALCCAILVSACSKKDRKRPRIQGERISVLSFERQLEADPVLGSVRVALPPPYVNKNWAQPGGNISHVMHHLFVDDVLTLVWHKKIGKGSKNYQRLVTAPVVAAGTVFTMDIEGRVSAFDAATGDRRWDVRLRALEERSKVGFGGGVTYYGGRIYATSGHGFVAALDARDGREIWREEFGIPFRSSATVASGRVYVLTHDNQLLVLDADSGELLWDHLGIVEDAGILGAAAPAITGDSVVVAFSSGELIAMRAENGQVAWQDSLGRTGRLTALATLNDIDGHPVIDRGRVYAINHSGRMVAIDLRTGERVWESNIGGLHTPWIAGNYIFIVSIDNEVAALSLRDGRVRWVTQLQRFEDQEDRKGVIRWSGPVLAGDRLIVVSTHGYILSLSPYTGEILGGEKLPDGTPIAPIVAGGFVYILSANGELLAYK